MPRARTARSTCIRRVASSDGSGASSTACGQHALGQGVATLHADPARDREVARRPERIEHALGGSPLPVALARTAEVARGDLAALARRGHDLVRERLVLLQDRPVPAMELPAGPLVAPVVGLVGRRQQARLVRPVLEHLPAAQQRVVGVGRHAGRSDSRARGAASGRRPRWSRSARSQGARCRRPARRGSPCAGATPGAACGRRAAARLRARSPASAQAWASHSSTSARVSTPIGVVPSATSTAGLDCRSW